MLYSLAHVYVIYTTYNVTSLLFFLFIASVIKAGILLYKMDLSYAIKIQNITLGTQWFYLGMKEVLGVVIKWIDKWFILFFLPLADFAIYFNASYEVPVFMLILSAIGSISLVELSKPENKKNRIIKRFYHRSVTLMSCIVFPAFWFFLLFAPGLIISFLGEKYAVAIPIFLCSIFILPIRIIYGATILQIYNKTNLILRGAVLDLVSALILIALLYPVWGMTGLALAFVISTYLEVGYYLWHTSKLLKEGFTFLITLKNIAVTFLSSGIGISLVYWATLNAAPIMKIVIAMVITAFLCLLLFGVFYKQRFGVVDRSKP